MSVEHPAEVAGDEAPAASAAPAAPVTPRSPQPPSAELPAAPSAPSGNTPAARPADVPRSSPGDVDSLMARLDDQPEEALAPGEDRAERRTLAVELLGPRRKRRALRSDEPRRSPLSSPPLHGDSEPPRHERILGENLGSSRRDFDPSLLPTDSSNPPLGDPWSSTLPPADAFSSSSAPTAPAPPPVAATIPSPPPMGDDELSSAVPERLLEEVSAMLSSPSFLPEQLSPIRPQRIISIQGSGSAPVPLSPPRPTVSSPVAPAVVGQVGPTMSGPATPAAGGLGAQASLGAAASPQAPTAVAGPVEQPPAATQGPSPVIGLAVSPDVVGPTTMSATNPASPQAGVPRPASTHQTPQSSTSTSAAETSTASASATTASAWLHPATNPPPSADREDLDSLIPEPTVEEEDPFVVSKVGVPRAPTVPVDVAPSLSSVPPSSEEALGDDEIEVEVTIPAPAAKVPPVAPPPRKVPTVAPEPSPVSASEPPALVAAAASSSASPGSSRLPTPPPMHAIGVPPGVTGAGLDETRKKKRQWFEELFNDDYARTMPRLSSAYVEREARFIDESLGCARGATILDLGCGTGAQAVALAQRGLEVIGVDLSLAMLARAADEAADRNQRINFVQGDMRDLSFDEAFDGVVCWGMTFGYFEDSRNIEVVQRVHRALRRGGRFLLDVSNRDFIVPRLPSVVWFEGEGCVCMDDVQLNGITSRMQVKRTMMMEDGRQREIEYSIRLYGLHELGKILHDSGFRVAEASGDTSTPGVFFGSESPRIVILAEKR